MTQGHDVVCCQAFDLFHLACSFWPDFWYCANDEWRMSVNIILRARPVKAKHCHENWPVSCKLMWCENVEGGHMMIDPIPDSVLRSREKHWYLNPWPPWTIFLNFWIFDLKKRHRLLVSNLGLLNTIWNIWWRNSCEERNWQRRRSMFCREKILFHKQGEEKKTREWGMTHYCSLSHHLNMVFKEPWDLDWPRKSQDRGQGVVVLTGALWRVRTKQEVSGQPPHFTNPSAPPCVTQAILPPRY